MATEVQTSDGKGDESGGKSKRARTVTVTILEHQGKSALVSWMDDDQYRRATIPANKLKGNDVSANVLTAGVPHGVDWAEILANEIPGADLLANEFRRQGIWTWDDFDKGSMAVRGALNRLFVVPLMNEIRSKRK